MPKLSEIRQLIATLLTQLTKANGYSFDMNPKQTFTAFDSKKLNDTNSANYPKIFVVTDTGASTDAVSNTKDRKLGFLLVIALHTVKIAGVEETPEQLANRMDDAQADVELIFDRNDTLGGQVHECKVTSYTTDSGFCYPQALCMNRLSLEILNEEVI